MNIWVEFYVYSGEWFGFEILSWGTSGITPCLLGIHVLTVAWGSALATADTSTLLDTADGTFCDHALPTLSCPIYWPCRPHGFVGPYNNLLQFSKWGPCSRISIIRFPKLLIFSMAILIGSWRRQSSTFLVLGSFTFCTVVCSSDITPCNLKLSILVASCHWVATRLSHNLRGSPKKFVLSSESSNGVNFGQLME